MKHTLLDNLTDAEIENELSIVAEQHTIQKQLEIIWWWQLDNLTPRTDYFKSLDDNGQRE